MTGLFYHYIYICNGLKSKNFNFLRFPEKIDDTFVTLPCGVKVHIKSHLTRCMFDGKLRDILTGRGGFCDQCGITCKQWHTKLTLMMVSAACTS